MKTIIFIQVIYDFLMFFYPCLDASGLAGNA